MPAIILNFSYFIGEPYPTYLILVQFTNIRETFMSFSRSSPVMSPTFIFHQKGKENKRNISNQTLILLGSFVRG